MINIHLIATTLVVFTVIAGLIYLNKMSQIESPDETADDYIDEDLTITLINANNIGQESDIK